uniref:28S ribosomal protein S18-2, mitochondrial n=1 Tax=Ascaris lumbricoides TaxID=6252 RepID=A0A0M3I7G5_ASCLU
MLPSTMKHVMYSVQMGLRLCHSLSTVSDTLALRYPRRIDTRLCHAEHKEDVIEAIGFAFNHIEKKKGLYKPIHSIEEQIAYMKSKAYEDAYKGLPIYHWYKRNHKGQAILQPRPRLYCIDKEGKFNVNNACPICRDEYLFFDYRNPALIEQFLASGTDQPIPLKRSGLCIEQYNQLKAQLLKAKEYGTIKFGVPFRNFDYSIWYSWWDGEEHVKVERGGINIENVHPDPLVEFPTHKRDVGNNWDQWWLRHDKFARKAK